MSEVETSPVGCTVVLATSIVVFVEVMSSLVCEVISVSLVEDSEIFFSIVDVEVSYAAFVVVSEVTPSVADSKVTIFSAVDPCSTEVVISEVTPSVVNLGVGVDPSVSISVVITKVISTDSVVTCLVLAVSEVMVSVVPDENCSVIDCVVSFSIAIVDDFDLSIAVVIQVVEPSIVGCNVDLSISCVDLDPAEDIFVVLFEVISTFVTSVDSCCVDDSDVISDDVISAVSVVDANLDSVVSGEDISVLGCVVAFSVAIVDGFVVISALISAVSVEESDVMTNSSGIDPSVVGCNVDF